MQGLKPLVSDGPASTSIDELILKQKQLSRQIGQAKQVGIDASDLIARHPQTSWAANRQFDRLTIEPAVATHQPAPQSEPMQSAQPTTDSGNTMQTTIPQQLPITTSAGRP